MADSTGRIPCGQKHVHTLVMRHTANFDRNGVGTYGAYHHKSELKRCNRVQCFFNPPKFAEISAILEPVNSYEWTRVPRDSIQASAFLQRGTRLHQV